MWTICSSVFVILTLRIMFTSLSASVKSVLGSCVGVHCNVLQLLDKEGCLRLRHRQRPFRDDSPGLKDRVTSSQFLLYIGVACGFQKVLPYIPVISYCLHAMHLLQKEAIVTADNVDGTS